MSRSVRKLGLTLILGRLLKWPKLGIRFRGRGEDVQWEIGSGCGGRREDRNDGSMDSRWSMDAGTTATTASIRVGPVGRQTVWVEQGHDGADRVSHSTHKWNKMKRREDLLLIVLYPSAT